MTTPEFTDEYFARLKAAGEHWWVGGMRRVAEALLGPRVGPLRILDAGSGTGANLAWAVRLAAGPRVRAFDLYTDGLRRSELRALPVDLLQASAAAVPFADGGFDLVLCMDVLQHLTADDERAALSEFARVLVPGGRLLARTGARWGRDDVAEIDDWRLYTPDRLAGPVTDAGLRVRRLTHCNAAGAVWARVRGGAGAGGSEEPFGLGIPRPVPGWRNRVLGAVVGAEATWLRRPGRTLPWGHTLYVLAEKPG